MDTLRRHWPEYASEAACLGLFMLSAAAFAVLLQHPQSPLSAAGAPPLLQRIPMGIAMGLTAVAIIYSPLGRRSGAHMNPALTFAFLRLRKIAPADAAGYAAGQFLGGTGGILLASWVLGGRPAHPSVNFVATVPGPAGVAAAFAAEAAISFFMMLMVLVSTNTARLSRFTGVFAGALVALYIAVEAPLSGMSMNPARTLGPALLSGTGRVLWVYFLAPTAGMLAAAELFVRWRGPGRVACAKLHHPRGAPCIFNCRRELSV